MAHIYKRVVISSN